MKLEDSKKVEIFIELKGDPEKICTSETKNSDSGTFLCFIASNFLMSGTEKIKKNEIRFWNYAQKRKTYENIFVSEIVEKVQDIY